MLFPKTTDGLGSAWRDGCLSQANSLDIRQKLRRIFVSAGLVESQSPESGPTPDMFFNGEGVSVCVIILNHTQWADRRAVMDSIMRASACAGKASRTYLALPKSAASLADAALFQEYGIGLFTYDQRNVDEALPARYFESVRSAPNQVQTTTPDHLENELHRLHVEFGGLQQVVHELKEELASLKSNAPRQFVQALAPLVDHQGVHLAENLPTFFSGNPWLEVLSRRGREETAIAG